MNQKWLKVIIGPQNDTGYTTSYVRLIEKWFTYLYFDCHDFCEFVEVLSLLVNVMMTVIMMESIVDEGNLILETKKNGNSKISLNNWDKDGVEKRTIFGNSTLSETVEIDLIWTH